MGDNSQVTFDALKVQAESLHFEADHILTRAAELDCDISLAQKKDKIQDAVEPYNRLRSVVALMTPLLSTHDANITKERAIIRRKYDQACQDLSHRRNNLLREIENNTDPDTSTQKDSASSGISSAQQSRTVHSESTFSGAWSLESCDGRVTRSASESQERAGTKNTFLFPVGYDRTSGNSITSRTSSEAIPIPGTSSAARNMHQTRQYGAGGGGGVNHINVGARFDGQPNYQEKQQHQQQQSVSSSTKAGMSYGSGETVVARSLHHIKISSDDEDGGRWRTTTPNLDLDTPCGEPQSCCSATALQQQQRVSDWPCHSNTQVQRLPDDKESQESTQHKVGRAVVRPSAFQPTNGSSCSSSHAPASSNHSSRAPSSNPSSRAPSSRAPSSNPSSRAPSSNPSSRATSSRAPSSNASSRDPSSSPLLSRAAGHRPIPSYASIEQPASPVSSSATHCDQAALLSAGQAVARPARCCGGLHCNKVLFLVLVIIVQAIIIAGLLFWKLYFP